MQRCVICFTKYTFYSKIQNVNLQMILIDFQIDVFYINICFNGFCSLKRKFKNSQKASYEWNFRDFVNVGAISKGILLWRHVHCAYQSIWINYNYHQMFYLRKSMKPCLTDRITFYSLSSNCSSWNLYFN